MIAKLLPSYVQVVEGPIERGTAPLLPAEAACVADACVERFQEFSTGRHFARSAIELLIGSTPPVPANVDRTPAWPHGIVGSITHTRQWCSVAVAHDRHAQAIGIDIEEIEKFDLAILPSVFTEWELETVLNIHHERERISMATLVFSAKEAFYKCQYPLTRKWLDFHDVVISLDRQAQAFTARRLDSTPSQLGADLLRGRFSIQGGTVATAIYMPRQHRQDEEPDLAL